MPARVLAVLLAFLVLAGWELDRPATVPFALPVGTTEWDLSEPTWIQNGVLHVGGRRVTIGDGGPVEHVVSPTGVYWLGAGGMLMFTSAEGEAQEVRHLGSSSLAISSDRSTLALLDGTYGPTDGDGTHVLQVAVFDTGTGEQLYRTPAEEPKDPDADLADLYEETTPYVYRVTNEQVILEGVTIDIETGDVTVQDPDGVGAYLFADR